MPQELPAELRSAAEKEGCSISTSTQSTKRWVNGQASWSKTMLFYKNCPGRSPEKVFESNSEGQGSEE